MSKVLHVMSNPARLGSVALTTVLFVAACGDQSPSPSQSASASPPRGGTLRLAMPGDFPPASLLISPEPDGNGALDPHAAFWYDSGELFHCCLVRTLVSHIGTPTDQGGTQLRPDLAESLPEASEDGLTWTFRLRQGIHYAPPLEETEITAADFVRAIHRLLRSGGGSHPAIDGVSEYVDGQATTVSGLETPDRYTLRIRVIRPAGDLPARMALPDMSPIPPSLTDPSAPFGVATGHDDDYGRFLVASGPYMVEGADAIDLSLPADEQTPASGYSPGKSLTLVRNPSWDPATDALRPAYVERIAIDIGGTLEEASARVDAGEIDFVFYAGPPPQSPLEQIERFAADPMLGRVHVYPRDLVRALAMNMALPPFDDVHVRKAVNLAIDKAGLIDLAGGPHTGEVAGHIVPNSLEDNLLLEYDPYRTPAGRGDAEAARAEMRQSAYDRNGDGRCDHPACDGVRMMTYIVSPGAAQLVADNLAEIGVQAVPTQAPGFEAFDRWFDPMEQIPLFLGLPNTKDYLNASSFFTGNFDSRNSMDDEFTNGTMVGASAERLAAWGYDPIELPNIDDRIDHCLAEPSTSQARCWAALDQYMMESIVPWAPYVFELHTQVTSNSVVEFSFDQFMVQPALDRIALEADE